MSTSRWASIIIGIKDDCIIKYINDIVPVTRYDHITGKPYQKDKPVRLACINGNNYEIEDVENLLSDHDLELIEISRGNNYIGVSITSTDEEEEIDYNMNFPDIRLKVITRLKMIQPNLDPSQVKMYLAFHES